MTPPPLIDDPARDAFASQAECNFSVIAPAGVGKTTSLVKRIVHLALTDNARADPLLPRLCVVTYTNRAAEEIRQRAYEAVTREGGAALAERLGSAFIGTLHAFAVRLLRRHGDHGGLPANLSLAERNEDELWERFERQATVPEDGISALLHWKDLLQLARNLPVETALDRCSQRVPTVPYLPDLSALLAFKPDKRNRANVSLHQGQLRRWLDLARAGTVLPLPDISKGGAAFKELWQRTMSRYWDQVAAQALPLAARLRWAFSQWRGAQGDLGHDDILLWAADLVQHPTVRRELADTRWSVLLDEAQDTDPVQLRILLAVASAGPDATPDGLPGPGRFCLVGDPQQSIYSSRADLPRYHALHGELTREAAQELTLSVTMRCAERICEAANTLVPRAFEGSGVAYVPLRSRPGAPTGQVAKIHLPTPPTSGLKSDGLARLHARTFAQWLKEQTPARLGASGWEEVALLSPRVAWLRPIESALADCGIPAQLLSSRITLGDLPAFRWCLALVLILAEPANGFELAGVLREILGLSDLELARYGQSGAPWSLIGDITASGAAADALRRLQDLRQRALDENCYRGLSLLLRELHLADRLAIAAPGGPNAAAELQRVLTLAVNADAAGLGWPAWAAKLRDLAATSLPDEAPRPGAVPLVSCHKAKGLGWDVVVWPFLFRKMRYNNPHFPRLLRGGGSVAVKMHGTHTPAAEYSAQQQERDEVARLAYVALTRAKRGLYLVDDAAFFEESDPSLGAILNLTASGCSRTWWEQLPAFEPVTEVGEVSAPVAPPLILTPDWEAAKAAATPNMTRTTPSALANSSGAPQTVATDPEPTLARADGTAYGLWWHQVMDTAPWPAGSDAVRDHGLAALAGAEDPTRAGEEWAAFCASELFAQLTVRGRQVRTEVPFFWRDGATLYEGFIDLLAQLPGGAWLVIDWKTDRLAASPDEAAKALLARYEPQVRVYRCALRDLLAAPVQAALYSTVLGRALGLDA